MKKYGGEGGIIRPLGAGGPTGEGVVNTTSLILEIEIVLEPQAELAPVVVEDDQHVIRR